MLVALACAVSASAAACGAAHASGGAGPVYELQATRLPGAGRVLTDGHGFTLYIYVPDHQGRSRCFELCAKNWPPLTLQAGVRHALAGPGVDAALLGTVGRGGTRQITYNGWPLYLWQGDQEPGQATGQADDMGLWYVISASGAVDRHQIPGQAGD